MISTIEAGYSDEPLFGFIGRIARGLRRRSRCAFAEWVFDSRTYTPHFEFPYRLDRVAEKLTSQVGISAEGIIDQMTMLPAISPFIEPTRVGKIEATMRGSGSSAMMGVMWRRRFGALGDYALRFCHRCRREDLKKFPHAWWRRAHQVPGVVCCPTHGDPLSISQFLATGRWLHEYVLVEEAVEVSRAPKPDGLDLFIAEQMQWLLQRPHITLIEPYSFRDVFRERLDQQGFVQSGRLCRRELCSAFHALRSPAEWHERGLSFDPDWYGSWPARIAQCDRNQHTPILFVALMRFLELTVETAIARANDPDRSRAPRERQVQISESKEQLIKRLWCDAGRRFWSIVVETGLSTPQLLA